MFAVNSFIDLLKQLARMFTMRSHQPYKQTKAKTPNAHEFQMKKENGKAIGRQRETIPNRNAFECCRDADAIPYSSMHFVNLIYIAI